jgi:hypothetical protein
MLEFFYQSIGMSLNQLSWLDHINATPTQFNLKPEFDNMSDEETHG